MAVGGRLDVLERRVPPRGLPECWLRWVVMIPRMPFITAGLQIGVVVEPKSSSSLLLEALLLLLSVVTVVVQVTLEEGLPDGG